MIYLLTNVAKTQDVPLDGTIFFGNTGQKDIAYVASVSIWFRNKQRPVLAVREMKWEPKNEGGGGGGGEGRKETLADEPLDFENLLSPANATTDWLG